MGFDSIPDTMKIDLDAISSYAGSLYESQRGAIEICLLWQIAQKVGATDLTGANLDVAGNLGLKNLAGDQISPSSASLQADILGAIKAQDVPPFQRFIQRDPLYIEAPILGDDAVSWDAATKVYRPSYDNPKLLSDNPADNNGIPAEANSIWITSKMKPIASGSVTREIVDLWRILGIGTLDGSQPSFAHPNGSGLPFSLYGKIIIPATLGPDLKAIGSHVPSIGDEAYRPLLEITFSPNYVPWVVIEPSLIDFNLLLQQVEASTRFETIFPILQGETESDWVDLPDISKSYATLSVPDVGDNVLNIRIKRKIEATSNGLLLGNRNIEIITGGLIIRPEDLSTLWVFMNGSYQAKLILNNPVPTNVKLELISA